MNSIEAPTRKFRFSKKELEEFRKNGYAGPFTLYDPEDMNEITKKLRYSLLDRSNSVYEFNEDINEINDRANYDRHLDVPFLMDHVKQPKIVDKLTDILGENVLCWRSEWFPKYPGDKGTDWHQVDTFEFSSGEPQLVWPQKEDFGGTITVWTALTDATIETACLKFMPGTHEELFYDESKGVDFDPEAIHDGFFGYDYQNLQKDSDWVPDESLAKSIEMKAGQFIIFWSTLMHASHSHLGKTNDMRLGYAARFVPDMVDVYPGNPKELTEFGSTVSLEKYRTVAVAGVNRNPNNVT
ncbi:chlorinating enzyme [Tenacibaculum sp. nBUS_03]|uniref:chlorinating enzyme n=1 Tax=Tenacibaculum sp. nBUS_03 TaxID=3395320 RepID=UPI003EBD55CB